MLDVLEYYSDSIKGTAAGPDTKFMSLKDTVGIDKLVVLSLSTRTFILLALCFDKTSIFF